MSAGLIITETETRRAVRQAKLDGTLSAESGGRRESKGRLLFVAHSASQGGGELCLDTLLRELDRDKYSATVVFPWDGPMADSARALGYDVDVRPAIWWMGWDFSIWYFKTLLIRTLPNIFWLA